MIGYEDARALDLNIEGLSNYNFNLKKGEKFCLAIMFSSYVISEKIRSIFDGLILFIFIFCCS